MTLVRIVLREISQVEGDVTADDIVNSIIEKMYANGSSSQACDDIRERLIGITLCALDVMINPEIVTDCAEPVWDSPALEPPGRILH